MDKRVEMKGNTQIVTVKKLGISFIPEDMDEETPENPKNVIYPIMPERIYGMDEPATGTPLLRKTMD